ncbi:MAG: glycosyltransferase [Patescibacteria group bacterium]
MKLTIIIPAYNEEKRISGMLEDYLATFSRDVEFWVVLNGCRDQTRQVVEAFASRFANLHFADIPEAIGKGGAIIEGFRRASGDVIAYVDADGSTQANELRRLIGEMGDADGVIASRWIAGATVSNRKSVMRKIGSRGFHFFIKLLFVLPYHDTQCGAKIFRASAISRILPHLHVTDMAFDVDLLYWVHRMNFRIREIPTVWEDQEGSATLGNPVIFVKASWKMVRSVVRLRLKHSPFAVFL